METKNIYSDIINLPRPVVNVGKHLSNRDRAAQFAPFSALSGYEDAVSETARFTHSVMELDEYEIEQLNRKLLYLREHENETEVTITYFVPDEKKAGGEYKTITGRIIKTDDYKKELTFDCGTVVLADRIADIECRAFDLYEDECFEAQIADDTEENKNEGI